MPYARPRIERGERPASPLWARGSSVNHTKTGTCDGQRGSASGQLSEWRLAAPGIITVRLITMGAARLARPGVRWYRIENLPVPSVLLPDNRYEMEE